MRVRKGVSLAVLKEFEGPTLQSMSSLPRGAQKRGVRLKSTCALPSLHCRDVESTVMASPLPYTFVYCLHKSSFPKLRSLLVEGNDAFLTTDLVEFLARPYLLTYPQLYNSPEFIDLLRECTLYHMNLKP